MDKDVFSTQLETWDTAEALPGPRTVFLIHGLRGNRSDWTKGKEFANSLVGKLDDPEFDLNVYVVDYNSGVQDGNEVPFRVFELDRVSDELVEVFRAGGRLDGFTQSLPLVSRLIKEAILVLPDVQPNISIVAHSMGGIVARDLVLHHYDELRNKGFRIADVITIASPHRGGGAGVPEVVDFQTEGACLALGIFDSSLHQVCRLELWHKNLILERQVRGAGGAPFIDNLDFPQIRWVSIASSDAEDKNDQLIFGFETPSGALNEDLLASDLTVAHISAFGLATDLCFPYVDQNLAPLSVSNRALRNIGESSAWIEHFWPPQIQNGLKIGFGYNLFNGFDVSPAALITNVSGDGAGSLNAVCHSPGPSSEFPDSFYAGDGPDSRFRATRPHGPDQNKYSAFQHYIKTVLTDGLRSPDIDGDGKVDEADRNRVNNAIGTKAVNQGFDVAADLDGDGFITRMDLELFPIDPDGGGGGGGSGSAVFRFLNRTTGTHLYTASTDERDAILDELADVFAFEGPAFGVADDPAGDTVEVHRFFNSNTGTHFYTASAEERAAVANLAGFVEEGVAFLGYVDDGPEREPLHRFFNSTTGTHFYTASESERAAVVENLPSFTYEGIAYFVDRI